MLIENGKNSSIDNKVIEASYCVTLIATIYNLKISYTAQIDKIEIKELFEAIINIFEKAIKEEYWEEWRKKYIRPVFENNDSAKEIMEIGFFCFDYIKKNNISIEDKIRQCLPEELMKLGRRLNEIQVFDCKFIETNTGDKKESKKRYLFLLEQYWQRYFQILALNGTALIYCIPNPLSRYITNLEYRMEKCVKEIGKKELADAYGELLKMDLMAAEDFTIIWECGGVETSAAFDKAIRKVFTSASIRKYKLTIEEELFLDSCDEAIRQESEKVKQTHQRANKLKVNKKESIGELENVHPKIIEKCKDLYKKDTYAEAVEKGFKVVRDRLRELTGYETGSEAFGKGKLHIKGASALNVDNDFNAAVKFLMMAIDGFRNEKAHTSDGKIDNPERAYHYLMMSSLAMFLLDNAEILS